MKRQVIVALDFPSGESTLAFLDKLGDQRPYVKVGMELYYREGNQILHKIKEKGYKIFLDLKLHDIPNTVENGMRSLSAQEVDMVNVHAAGGLRMMEAARKGIEAGAEERGLERPLIIAVTMLTSLSPEEAQDELGLARPLKDTALEYAKLAKKAGLDGVVCSALESPMIHQACGDDFLTVTPGIRFSSDAKGDQRRVVSPARANELGSSFIVVGRSITGAEDPEQAYLRCVREFEEG